MGKAVAIPPDHSRRSTFEPASKSLLAPMKIWNVVGSMSLTAIDPVWVENLSDIYVFRGYAEVSGFLRGHSYLFPTLIEAHQVIEKHFGDRTPVVLKVFTDPESDEDVELFALIQTSLPLDDALERLNDLDEEWWLEASSQTECRLNIDVEYI